MISSVPIINHLSICEALNSVLPERRLQVFKLEKDKTEQLYNFLAHRDDGPKQIEFMNRKLSWYLRINKETGMGVLPLDFYSDLIKPSGVPIAHAVDDQKQKYNIMSQLKKGYDKMHREQRDLDSALEEVTKEGEKFIPLKVSHLLSRLSPMQLAQLHQTTMHMRVL